MRVTGAFCLGRAAVVMPAVNWGISWLLVTASGRLAQVPGARHPIIERAWKSAPGKRLGTVFLVIHRDCGQGSSSSARIIPSRPSYVSIAGRQPTDSSLLVSTTKSPLKRDQRSPRPQNIGRAHV